MERKKITFDSFIRGVILGVIIIGILMLLKRLSSVLLPFFIAWLIAYLVYPLVTFFQYKLKLRNRIVSIFCALLTLLIVGAGAFYLLVPPMIQECGRVQTLLVQYFSHGTYNSNVPTSLSDFLRDNIDVKFITELFNKENLLDALKEAVPRLWSLLSDSVDLLFSVFTIFIILLYVIFILLDYESIAEGWTHLVPMKYRSFVVGILNDVKVGMNRYFRGQAFVALCVGILFSIGFLIIDFPIGHRSRFVHRGIEYGALSSNHRFGSYYHTGNPESLRHRREFLDNHRLSHGSIHCSANYPRRIHRATCYGENYRTKSCYHSIITFHMGFINGNVGNDYRTTAHNADALLLSTFHYQQRKYS